MADESRVTVRMRLLGAATMARDSKRVSRGLGGIGREGRRTTRVQSALGRSGGSVASGFRRAATATAGLGAAYLGLRGASTAIQTTEELAKSTKGLHDSFGLSITQASRFAGVLKSRGVDAKATTMAFSSLSKNIVAARKGTKTAVANFETLGLSQRDVARDGLDFNAIIMRTADALHANKRDFRAAAAARAIFGRGFTTMVPLLRQGSKGLQETLEAADKYGVTLTDKTIGPVLELVKSQRELKLAGLGLQVQLTRLLVPGLLKLEHAAERVLTVFNRRDLTLPEKITESGKIIKPLIVSIGKSGPEISKAVTQIVTAAAPAIAKSAGVLGVAVVKGMWAAITDPKSGLFTKAILLAFIAKKLGLFGLLGALAGRAFRRRFGAPIPTPTAPAPVPGAAPVGGGFPAGGIAGFAGAMAPFLGLSALGLGIAAAGGGHFGGEFRGGKEAQAFLKRDPRKGGIVGDARSGLFVAMAQKDARNVSRRQRLFGRALASVSGTLGRYGGVVSRQRGGYVRVGGMLVKVRGAFKGLLPGLQQLSPEMRRLKRSVVRAERGLADALQPLADPGGPPAKVPKTKRGAGTTRPSGRKKGQSPQARFRDPSAPVVHVHNTVDSKGLHTTVWHRERKIAEAR